jgi:hypothetical protein
MQFSPDATISLNDYVDRVRLSLPMSPSARIAASDRLYQDLCRDASALAADRGQTTIGADVVRDVLAKRGSAEQCAKALADSAAAGEWQWPGDVVADAMRRHKIGERVDQFARAAAEQGERVARTSIDMAVQALDVAAQKLQEAVERLKSR